MKKLGSGEDLNEYRELGMRMSNFLASHEHYRELRIIITKDGMFPETIYGFNLEESKSIKKQRLLYPAVFISLVLNILIMLMISLQQY
jgi:hypothetical protein